MTRQLCYRCADKMRDGFDVKQVGTLSGGGKCEECRKKLSSLQVYEITQKEEKCN